MPDISESTKRTRLKAAGWARLNCWVPRDDPYWSAVLKREPAMIAKAERIAATPGKRGRPAKEEKG